MMAGSLTSVCNFVTQLGARLRCHGKFKNMPRTTTAKLPNLQIAAFVDVLSKLPALILLPCTVSHWHHLLFSSLYMLFRIDCLTFHIGIYKYICYIGNICYSTFEILYAYLLEKFHIVLCTYVGIISIEDWHFGWIRIPFE